MQNYILEKVFLSWRLLRPLKDFKRSFSNALYTTINFSKIPSRRSVGNSESWLFRRAGKVTRPLNSAIPYGNARFLKARFSGEMSLLCSTVHTKTLLLNQLFWKQKRKEMKWSNRKEIHEIKRNEDALLVVAGKTNLQLSSSDPDASVLRLKTSVRNEKSSFYIALAAVKALTSRSTHYLRNKWILYPTATMKHA